MNSSTSVVSCVINDRAFQVTKGSTILQACEQSGLVIPRFCYHDRLSIAGNCRMCLVQLDKVAKPVASCALEVSPGMKVYTNSSVVKKAREGVMEFLLANHPLDCPICDQGGECDLQDQALIFGNDRGRFYETKRSVSDKDWGHLIKTVMTRCIHCTRCQRFSSELSGQVEVAMLGRGGKSEITNFLGNLVRSEVSGNVIDLCPVGALTSKPYAFSARPWELLRVESVDTTDSMGSNLSFQITNQRVLRVLPVLHQRLNEEWLSNRARFMYDAFRLQRIVYPMHSDGSEVSTLVWSQALLSFLFSVGPFFSFSTIIGESSLKSAYYLKLLASFSSKEEAPYGIDQRDHFSVSPSYMSLTGVDLVIVVGIDLRRDLPLFLVRLRLEQAKRDLTVLTFGSFELGLPASQAGVTVNQLFQFLQGRHPHSFLLKRVHKAAILISNSILPALSVQSIRKLAICANKNVLLGVVPVASTSFNNLSESGVSIPSLRSRRYSDILVNTTSIMGSSFDAESTVYLGSYGFDWLIRPNLLMLPVSNSLESEGYYLNLEGRLQLSRRVLTNVGSKSLDVLLGSLLFTLCGSSFSFDLDLIINKIYKISKALDDTFSVYTSDSVCFSTPSFALYQTTPVTHVSPLLLRSAQVERKSVISAFPSV